MGLLAYALYKQSIREEIAKGRQVDGSTRDPPPTTVEVFRHSASRILQEFADSAIEEARPEFERSSLASKLDALETSMKAHIDSRTSWGSAILTNIVGWAVTVVLAVIVLLALTTPSWYPALMNMITGEDPAPPPASRQISPGE